MPVANAIRSAAWRLKIFVVVVVQRTDVDMPATVFGVVIVVGQEQAVVILFVARLIQHLVSLQLSGAAHPRPPRRRAVARRELCDGRCARRTGERRRPALREDRCDVVAVCCRQKRGGSVEIAGMVEVVGMIGGVVVVVVGGAVVVVVVVVAVRVESGFAFERTTTAPFDRRCDINAERTCGAARRVGWLMPRHTGRRRQCARLGNGAVFARATDQRAATTTPQRRPGAGSRDGSRVGRGVRVGQRASCEHGDGARHFVHVLSVGNGGRPHGLCRRLGGCNHRRRRH